MMRKLWPILFSLALTILKPLLLALAGRYHFIMLPGDIAFSVLAYDIWAITEQFAGHEVVNKDKENWLIMSILLHLIVYIIFILLSVSFPQILNNSIHIVLFASLFLAYLIPGLIVLDLL